jgi:cytochrome P450
MRHSPVIFGTIRKALEDVELDGVTVPAGTHLMVNTAAANRDPAVYGDPDRLDITREGSATMLTFGGGIHYCLGAHLARAELAEALIVITRRMPNPRRSGSAPWKRSSESPGPPPCPSTSTLDTEPADQPRTGWAATHLPIFDYHKKVDHFSGPAKQTTPT